ncbi:dimethylarginine dimethylaminohydrolase family protein [Fusibacter ferrireducens]|uniref:N(G),N(G)-dimethylarginine dimethylaminohydrolase n=1 Tax=Fusibacter ferrireducens TaxID=2785058 RepID=A0ABR9ZTS5_9FIRM|nr:arginine deiminase family protein [Fusibacter ferrireducens]MBF4693756.1 N(G),N(G)-dimethylarginine dimethylaminohydrolase [Fusibacter ferrireducens]
MFKNCIVRRPSKSMIEGITSAPELGKPDYELALKQHDAYIETLKQCGVKVKVLDAMEAYPDSCFVEDVAICTSECAVITNPGAKSRNGEIIGIKPAIEAFFQAENIHHIEFPGTLDGGDVMMVGKHFYIGISERTNKEGASQLISHLNKYGMTGEAVALSEVLHLKTALAYLENNNLLVGGEFITSPIFEKFNKIEISDDESYSCNCIWVNGKVIVPEGYPKTQAAIEERGYEVLIVDTSEYRKLDGGLSCLSLRF